MTRFFPRVVSLDKINSMTKYPSIPTYHPIDPQTGLLVDSAPVEFPDSEPIYVTEKVDGTNGRLISFFGEDYFIGSREQILYALFDYIKNPELGIVPELINEISGRFNYSSTIWNDAIYVFYYEVFGSPSGNKWKNYFSEKGKTRSRQFDVARIEESTAEDLAYNYSLEQISTWRRQGGLEFLQSRVVLDYPNAVPTVVIYFSPKDLPRSIEDTYDWMKDLLPRTLVGDDDGVGRPEGLVIRNGERSVIAKLRFSDYMRYLSQQ